jgi:transcription-repair coupling factor (superfamily II helicase)
LRELQVEMIDRFGLLPEPVRHLFAVTQLKLAATPLGIRKLEVGANGGRVIFRPQPAIEPLTVIRLIQSQPRIYALDGQDKLKFKMPLEGASERLRAANELLASLGARRAA